MQGGPVAKNSGGLEVQVQRDAAADMLERLVLAMVDKPITMQPYIVIGHFMGDHMS